MNHRKFKVIVDFTFTIAKLGILKSNNKDIGDFLSELHSYWIYELKARKMEYWQLIEFLTNKKSEISGIDILDRHFHWTILISCEDRKFYVGVDYENVELACREVYES